MGAKWYRAKMAQSRKVIAVDVRRRIALGGLARHDMYFAAVDAEGVITLTPAAIVVAAGGPLPPRPRRRGRAAKATPD